MALYDTGDDNDGPAAKTGPRNAATGGSAIYDTGDDDPAPVTTKTAAKTGARPGAASQIYDTGDDFVVAAPAPKTKAEESFGFNDSFDAPLVGTATATTTAGASPVLGRSADPGKRILLPEEVLQDVGIQHVGMRVAVEKFGEGTLRFFGPHHRDGKPRCGVELDEANGINNGTVGVGYVHYSSASLTPIGSTVHFSIILNPLCLLIFGGAPACAPNIRRTTTTSRAPLSTVCW